MAADINAMEQVAGMADLDAAGQCKLQSSPVLGALRCPTAACVPDQVLLQTCGAAAHLSQRLVPVLCHVGNLPSQQQISLLNRQVIALHHFPQPLA